MWLRGAVSPFHDVSRQWGAGGSMTANFAKLFVTGVIGITAMATAGAIVVTAQETGPTRPLYVTGHTEGVDNLEIRVIRDGSVVNVWPMAGMSLPTPVFEYALAVDGSVWTLGIPCSPTACLTIPPSALEYPIAGGPPTAVAPLTRGFPNIPDLLPPQREWFFDGTTDGVNNYGVAVGTG